MTAPLRWKVGEYWPAMREFDIIDTATGEPVTKVREFDIPNGWLVRLKTNDEGMPFKCDRNPPCFDCDANADHVATERLDGIFKLVRRTA